MLRRIESTGRIETAHRVLQLCNSVFEYANNDEIADHNSCRGLQWHKDAIERQLAHGERDKVRGSYNFAEHLPERRRMMQAWSDYLDSLRPGAQVVPLKRAG